MSAFLTPVQEWTWKNVKNTKDVKTWKALASQGSSKVITVESAGALINFTGSQIVELLMLDPPLIQDEKAEREDRARMRVAHEMIAEAARDMDHVIQED